MTLTFVLVEGEQRLIASVGRDVHQVGIIFTQYFFECGLTLKAAFWIKDNHLVLGFPVHDEMATQPGDVTHVGETTVLKLDDLHGLGIDGIKIDVWGGRTFSAVHGVKHGHVAVICHGSEEVGGQVISLDWANRLPIVEQGHQ